MLVDGITKLKAIHFRHVNIAQNEIRLVTVENLQRLFPVNCSDNLETGLRQPFFNYLSDCSGIIYSHYRLFAVEGGF